MTSTVRPAAPLDPFVGTSSLEEVVQTLLYVPRPDTVDQAAEAVQELTRALVAAADTGDQEALRQLHSALYRINLAAISCPWQHEGLNVSHPLFGWLREAVGAAWLDDAGDRANPAVADVPTDPDGFVRHVTAVIHNHRSGVQHPLFRFLQHDAALAQLREFHLQESPLDVVFADLLCFMMAGLPGQLRQELASNFWDEMGNGQLDRTHRSLRERMTVSLGLSPTAYIDSVERFVREELALANLYYRAAIDRRALVEGIGIMLATEVAVPGRVECQLEGCLRVGLSPDDVQYLAEHVTVDVGHAEGWMQAVVLPIVREHPGAVTDLMLGVWRRLEHAAAVCDRMYRDLRSVK